METIETWRGLAELYKKAYNIRVELTYIRSDDLDDLMYPCEKCLCLHGRRSYLKDKVIKTCSICSVAKCDISFKYILATKEIKGVNQGETEIIRSDDCCETCLPKLDHICSECIVNGKANELINDFIVFIASRE